MAKFATRPKTDAPLVEQFGNDESIQAAVTPIHQISQRARQDLFKDDKWQTKARYFDRNGPGIFGAALDMPSATSTLLEPYIRVPSSQGWDRVDDDPLFNVLLRMWRGEKVSAQTLFARMMRTLDLAGEGYMILHNPDDPDRAFWQLAQTTNVFDKRNGYVDVKTKPDARAGSKWHRTVPNEMVWHFHQEDPEWEGCAWSPMRRGLVHLEMYAKVMRNMGRNVDSQLAMNGILWAKAISEKTNWQEAIKHWAHAAITSDEGIEGVIPFLMQTVEKPELIEIGRGQHSEHIALADNHLKAFASSTDLPTNMLLEGPGQANHWNAYLEGDFYADMTMAPRWRRVCQIVTDTHVRPLLKAYGHPDAETAEFWMDDHRIRTKTDNSDRVMGLFDRGIANREAAAEVGGLRDDQILPLPDGVSEYEAWLLSRSPGLAQRANQIIPDETPDELDDEQIVPGLRSGEPVQAGFNYPDELVPA